MSPDLMQWRLEGLEIVNPNHLANAGTIGDRPTATGGGVNMLSNLTLSNSMLRTGIMPGYGNATSGIMDMYFREGNTNDYQHTVQIGLLGIQGGTEGPFKKGGKSSYMINGRYSTVGLLSSLGVDFGDEQIRFGEVAFNTNFVLGQNGAKLKVYGVVGSNSNKFEVKEPEEWEEDKDRHDISYASGTDIIGVNFTQPISSRSLLTLRAVYSRNAYERTDNIRDPDTGLDTVYRYDDGKLRKWSTDIRFSTVVGDRVQLGAGINTVLDDYDILEEPSSGLTFVNTSYSEQFRPYVYLRSDLSSAINLNAGLAVSRYTIQSSVWMFEPELELGWQLNEAHKITLGYRLSSQSMAGIYREKVGSTEPVLPDIEPIRSHHAYITHQAVLGPGILETSVRYINLFNVPVDSRRGDYSALNLNPFTEDRMLVNGGEGNNLSVLVGYRKNFVNSWFASGNAGFIMSEYKGADGITRSTTYDIGATIFLSAGKEWAKERDFGLRTWGVNASIIYHGGLREGVIDPVASEATGQTVYADGTQSDVQLDDYFRMDLRAYWRKDKAKTSSTISLDVQNLIGVENAWFSTYDFLFGEVRSDTQLGLIPVLSWRLDF